MARRSVSPGRAAGGGFPVELDGGWEKEIELNSRASGDEREAQSTRVTVVRRNSLPLLSKASSQEGEDEDVEMRYKGTEVGRDQIQVEGARGY